MSVTSVEALEALPVGQVISVKPNAAEDPVDWTRREDGTWARIGAAVPGALESHMFAGYLGAGWVNVGATVTVAQVGQWRQGTSYWYYVLSMDGTNATVMRFRRNQSTDPVVVSSVRMAEYTLLATPPEIHQQRWVTALNLLWARAEAERIGRAAESERARVQLKNRVDPATLHPAVTRIRDAVVDMERALQQANAPAEF